MSQRKLALLTVCIAIVLTLAVSEIAARLLATTQRGDSHAIRIGLGIEPYMIFTSRPGENPTWQNPELGTQIPSTMKFNRMGFSSLADMTFPASSDFIREFGLDRRERLVVLTGGSAVYGVGATSDDSTIAGQLERMLNAQQQVHRYRVLNLAMGGWIAYQQFVGLSIYAAPLKPDWVIAMDGFNDGLAGCMQGNGVGRPYGWAGLLHLTAGFDGGRARQRDPVSEWLLRNVALARLLTGAEPSTNAVDDTYLDPKNQTYRLPDIRFDSLDRQIDFYLLAQRNVAALFPEARVLLGTQPLLYNNIAAPLAYREAFAFRGDRMAAKATLSADLDALMAKLGTSECSQAAVGSWGLSYFMGRSAMKLEEQVSQASRPLGYFNQEMIFPRGRELRLSYFVDGLHMSDLGQRHSARHLAGMILAADAGIPFDPGAMAAEAAAAALKRSGFGAQPYTPPAASARAISKTPIVERIDVADMKDGTLKLTEEPQSGSHRALWLNVPRDGADGGVAFEVWSDSIFSVRLEMLDRSGGYGRANFDLVNLRTSEVGGAGVRARVEDAGKGWRRVTLKTKLTDAAIDFNIALLFDDIASYQGTGRSVVVSRPVLVPGQ